MPFLIFAVEISSRKSVAFRKLTWIVNVFSFFLVVNYIIFVFFPLSFGESTFVKSLSFVPYIFLKPNCWKIREKWIPLENTILFPVQIILYQVILFEIDCAIFDTNLHQLFCQFRSWTNWVNSGKFMDNWWISCQVTAYKVQLFWEGHQHLRNPLHRFDVY